MGVVHHPLVTMACYQVAFFPVQSSDRFGRVMATGGRKAHFMRISRCAAVGTGGALLSVFSGQLLAAFLPVALAPQDFRDCSVNFWIDNMCALSAFVLGGSTARDIAHFALAAHSFCTHARLLPWFEFLASASNVADGGSRHGVADQIAPRLKIQLSEVPFPTFLGSPELCALWQSRLCW